ncbi:MAG: SCP2 sterol-binding domain-containing protein [Spirochaetes bacterium]|nr:SCP2 sterol-binding domain-containing protein [Spirochaetota bacterium]
MKYWKDSQEAVTAIKKMWDLIGENQELREAAKKVNQLILFDYSVDEPNCGVWFDCRDGGYTVGTGIPSDTPDLTMSCSLDDAHLSWMDQLNPVIAITRKRVKVKGNATGMLRLVPKLKIVKEIYKKALTDLGMADKLNM